MATERSTNALAVVPPVCPISAAGGMSKHKLVNQCDRRLAFKVKCSNNSNYSVNVNRGFLDVGEEVEFVITRTNGKPKADRMLFLFADVLAEATDPAAPFIEHPKVIKGKITGETTVKLSAAE